MDINEIIFGKKNIAEGSFKEEKKETKPNPEEEIEIELPLTKEKAAEIFKEEQASKKVQITREEALAQIGPSALLEAQRKAAEAVGAVPAYDEQLEEMAKKEQANKQEEIEIELPLTKEKAADIFGTETIKAAEQEATQKGNNIFDNYKYIEPLDSPPLMSTTEPTISEENTNTANKEELDKLYDEALSLLNGYPVNKEKPLTNNEIFDNYQDASSLLDPTFPTKKEEKADSMIDAMANGTIDTNGEPIVPTDGIKGNSKGYSAVVLLGLATTVVSVGIIALGVFLTR